MRAVILAAAVVLAGCDVASSALGRDAMLQVDGAQWRPGPRPDDDGGPTVSEVLLRRPTVVRDGLGQRVTGALAPSATGLWLGADGDVGGWIVTADAPGNSCAMRSSPSGCRWARTRPRTAASRRL